MKEQGLTVINKDKQDYSDDDVVLFNENWLNLEDFDLKIIITLLLNEKTICSYTTRDLCDYLGLSYHSKNINRIKRSLSSLEDDNNIIYNYCNHLYSIKIINKHIDTIGFKRSWLTTLKNYKDIESFKDISLSWVKLIKVFIYLYKECLNPHKSEYIKFHIQKLSMSYESFRKAYNIIKGISFDQIVIYKDTECICLGGNAYIYKPTKFDFAYDWSK